MKQNTIILGLVVVVLVVVAYVSFKTDSTPQSVVVSPLNAIYTIEGETVELTNGVSDTQLTPGSATHVITRYFGNEVKYDFNSDGKLDVAFLLTQTSGGSGTFYYIVAGIQSDTGFVGSEGYLIGDRISPQTTEMSPGGIVVVNFAERKLGQSMTEKPSIAKSMWFKFDKKKMAFVSVPKPSNPGLQVAISLDSQKWNWSNTTYGDGKKIVPKNKGVFVLIFRDSVTFSAVTDCNSLGGEYLLDGNKISFTNIVSTKMFCEGSQEVDFTKTLSEVASYHFGPNKELIFDLKYDSGIAVFN